MSVERKRLVMEMFTPWERGTRQESAERAEALGGGVQDGAQGKKYRNHSGVSSLSSDPLSAPKPSKWTIAARSH